LGFANAKEIAMPPIETKAQLLVKLRESRAALKKVIAKVDPGAWTLPNVCGEWSAKDVLAHVAHWQDLHLGWWAAYQRGETPQVPAPGYTWKDIDRLNQQIYRAHCDQSLEAVLQYLQGTYERFMALVEATPEEDLFRQGQVPFVGKGTLARWYIDYAHHDGFGRNKIYQALVRKSKAKAAAQP
jgi:hypothetical protein